MAINTGFWKNKKVLLTGHTGFKGAWLAQWLKLMDAQIYGVSLAPQSKPNLFTELNLEQKMQSDIFDIKNMTQLKASMDQTQPEVIFHLAAQSLVRPSYENPVETFATNVMGTVHVLEVARSIPSVKAVVIVTSDKCYENKEWLWGYRENEPLGGYDPYSASKGCAEIITSAFRRSFFKNLERAVGVASVRAGNVIGGGDWSDDRLIPDAMRAFSNNESVFIRNPQSTRPWQHVLEPLHGYLKVAENLWTNPVEFSEAWNFGPDASSSVEVYKVIDSLVDNWGDGAQWHTDQVDQKKVHEAGLLNLDSSKARSLLDWQPCLDLHETLRWTANWYKDFYNGKNPVKLTIDQIRRFSEF